MVVRMPPSPSGAPAITSEPKSIPLERSCEARDSRGGQAPTVAPVNTVKTQPVESLLNRLPLGSLQWKPWSCGGFEPDFLKKNLSLLPSLLVEPPKQVRWSSELVSHARRTLPQPKTWKLHCPMIPKTTGHSLLWQTAQSQVARVVPACVSWGAKCRTRRWILDWSSARKS